MSDYKPKGDPRGLYWCSTRCGKFHVQHADFGDCEIQHKTVLAGQDICVPWLLDVVKQNAKMEPAYKIVLERLDRQREIILEHEKQSRLQVDTISVQSRQLRGEAGPDEFRG